jgi:pyruvate dehydrogenase (quinone)
VPDFRYARYAESLGLKGILVDTPNAIGRGWDEALAADRPVVIDAITDPDVPPMPPHITFDQARAYASALLKGDPNKTGVIRQTFREMVLRADAYFGSKLAACRLKCSPAD